MHEIHETSSENVNNNQVLWGTSINLTEIQNKFKQFILNFRLDNDGDSLNYYIKQLHEIKDTEVYILSVDGRHIYDYDRNLYRQLINYPTEMIPIMDIVVSNLFSELFNTSERFIQVKTTALNQHSRIRDLGPDDIDKLICISGLTIRTSEIIPEMREVKIF